MLYENGSVSGLVGRLQTKSRLTYLNPETLWVDLFRLDCKKKADNNVKKVKTENKNYFKLK